MTETNLSKLFALPLKEMDQPVLNELSQHEWKTSWSPFLSPNDRSALAFCVSVLINLLLFFCSLVKECTASFLV